MRTFFEDAEGFEIFVFVELASLGEAVFAESVLDFAGRTEVGSEDGDDAEDDDNEKSPPALPDGDGGKTDAN